MHLSTGIGSADGLAGRLSSRVSTKTSAPGSGRFCPRLSTACTSKTRSARSAHGHKTRITPWANRLPLLAGNHYTRAMTQIEAPKSAQTVHDDDVIRYAMKAPSCPACYESSQDMKKPYEWFCWSPTCKVLVFAGPKEARPF